jgi:hypothetical protein
MFGIKIQGRLGNQLFQYAYAKVLSRKFNTAFFFLNAKEFYAHKYFEMDVQTPFHYRLEAIRFWIRNMGRVKKVIERQTESPEWNKLNESDNAVYIGFYQSKDYHTADLLTELDERLIIKPEYLINIRNYVPNDKPNIVVHIRRTDYVAWGGEHLGGYNLTLPTSYYHKALAMLPVKDCNLFFLSDDMAYVKENFIFENAIYAGKNSEIVDFQIIMQADYLVLANSSFSWWGAYLNKRAKMVISSKFWLGIKFPKEYPAGIVNKDWISIE